MTDTSRYGRWAIAVLLGMAAPVLAADRCLSGGSAASDGQGIAAVRGQIALACPCAGAASHGAYVQCAKAVVNDASDGTPLLGQFSLRTQCRGTVKKIAARSACGYAESRVACCEHAVASGKNKATIKPVARCADSGSTLRRPCFATPFAADACSGDVMNSCAQEVVQATVDIPSAAAPAETPGSPGVVVSNPNLITQFGGASFSLNNARYTRFRLAGPEVQPDAILVLVPGFEGGAGTFKILAENLIPKAAAGGQIVEVWAYDRRTNQLEDTTGLELAEQYLSPHVALDWLYGAELSLPLSPVLAAGPNRRAFFHDAQDDIPFLANWTGLVFSRDIDAVVEAARAAARNQNVFLGGHSAGTGFTARYAATDFNLTGAGPPDPGYAKLRGLVLLEGGGGSTGGTPLTADTLDRIIAKFDGGLFGAVRDNAARCVDGTTACTIATEAADCVGQVPPKCTPPATAYALALGLLNPRILAAAEPVTLQGAIDPDGGQSIIQVEQGAPGNTAILKVPDLITLSALPQATAHGGLASFLDDDGLVASIASFVATSLGAPGPTVGGLATWLDVGESGQFPTCPGASCVTPDNGAAPTTFPPATRWGLEKEVTRIDRMMTTFYAGGTNFTDWYYPSAGLSVTSVAGQCSGLSGSCTVGNVGAACSGATQAAADTQCSQAVNLDSSALSIGRGRRDIENLTQAAAIDVPVIAFGGTDGLTPVGGSFVAFASSIGMCTAPSCDGSTPRVVDAALPTPAFPTFGGVAGGFEVHLSEGFAHVDVLTAEDDADNDVLGPLVDFLARNAN